MSSFHRLAHVKDSVVGIMVGVADGPGVVVGRPEGSGVVVGMGVMEGSGEGADVGTFDGMFVQTIDGTGVG